MLKKKKKGELRFDYEDRARGGFAVVIVGTLLGLLLFAVVVYKLYETSLIGPQYRLGFEAEETEEEPSSEQAEESSGQSEGPSTKQEQSAESTATTVQPANTAVSAAAVAPVEFDMGKLVAGEAKAWQETAYWREAAMAE
ncbi:hypothetical protein IJG78_02305 [Candidatus Saccharibacteria bacterium]|nr:hypothetical protein [Candidatus Saccharibacteria bacterium]